MISLVGSTPARAQGEKRTVFAPDDFHWPGRLMAGLPVYGIFLTGEFVGWGAAGVAAVATGTSRGYGDDREFFVEVVEYSDGVTICAVYARDKAPGHCHRGGVSSESSGWWHGNRAKINFDIQVPRGVRFNALTTNGNVLGHNLASVVEAATTNGNVDVSTSEWASATTTNGGIHVSIGNAKWSGELKVRSTNGSVDVTLPASAEFKLEAATTNGGIHTDFPITVQGSFNSKELSGTVGGGGRELRVATTNGTIKLTKS
jgi:hypothetical protein